MNKVQEFLQERGLTKRASYNQIRKVASLLKMANPEIAKSYQDAYNKVNKYKPKRHTRDYSYGIGYMDHFGGSTLNLLGQTAIHALYPFTLLFSGHGPALYSEIMGGIKTDKLNNFKSKLDPYQTMRLGSTVGKPQNRPKGLGAQAERDYKQGRLKQQMNYLQGI